MKQYIYGKNTVMEALKGSNVYTVYMQNNNKDKKVMDFCRKRKIPLAFVDKTYFDKNHG